MEKRLTAREERFCALVAGGMFVRDAFKDAYKPGTNNEHSINSMTTELLNKDHIAARIEELRKPLASKAINDVQAARLQQEQLIKERIEICKDIGDETSLIRYIDMLNKIYGIYKDIPGDQVENKLETVNDDLLKKLAMAV